MFQRWLLSSLISALGLLIITGSPMICEGQARVLSLGGSWKPEAVQREKPVPANLAATSQWLQLEKARARFPKQGEGITVAVIGSGLRSNHPDFEGQIKPAVGFKPGHDLGSLDEDEHGTGTFVSGIIAADEVNQGIASLATLLSLKIVDAEGQWTIDDLSHALGYLLSSLDRNHVSVVYLALTDGGTYQNLNELQNRVSEVRLEEVQNRIKQLRQRNVVILAPTGDSRMAADRPGIAFPAICPGVIPISAMVESGSSEDPGISPGLRVGTAQWLPNPKSGLGLEQAMLYGPNGPKISSGAKRWQAVLEPGGSLQAAAVATGVATLLQSNYLAASKKLPPEADVRRWLLNRDLKETKSSVVPEVAPDAPIFRINALAALAAMERDLLGSSPADRPADIQSPVSNSLSGVLALVGVDRIQALPLIMEGKATNRRLSGEGTVVAVVSTGVAPHQDFKDNRIVSPKSFVMGESRADPEGLGTLLAGIIGADGLHRGIAPRTRIIPVRVFDENGAARQESLASAMEWLADSSERLRLSAVLLDGGGHMLTALPADFSESEQRIIKQIGRLRALRIPVIVPAGNKTEEAQKGQGMSFPAILRETISVGAFELATMAPKSSDSAVQQFTTNTPELQIAPYSLRLPSDEKNWTGFGTDILAPGGPVVSTGNKGNQSSASMRGTLIAAAITTGVVLLLQEYHMIAKQERPEVDHLEECLKRGGWYITDPESGKDLLRLDALNALRECRRKDLLEEKK